MPTGKQLTSQTASSYFVSQGECLVNRTGVEMELQEALCLVPDIRGCAAGGIVSHNSFGIGGSVLMPPELPKIPFARKTKFGAPEDGTSLQQAYPERSSPFQLHGV
jgi:hypothetical protein